MPAAKAKLTTRKRTGGKSATSVSTRARKTPDNVGAVVDQEAPGVEEDASGQLNMPLSVLQSAASVPKQRGKKNHSVEPFTEPGTATTATTATGLDTASMAARPELDRTERPRRPAATVARQLLEELAAQESRTSARPGKRAAQQQVMLPVGAAPEYDAQQNEVGNNAPWEDIDKIGEQPQQEVGPARTGRNQNLDDEIDFELAPAQSTAIDGFPGAHEDDVEHDAGAQEIIFSFEMGGEGYERPADGAFSESDDPGSEEEVVPAGTRKGKKARTPAPEIPAARPANGTLSPIHLRILDLKLCTVLLSVPDYTKPKRPQTTVTFIKAQNLDFVTAHAVVKKALGADATEDIKIAYKMYRSDPVKRKFDALEDWSEWLDNIEKFEKKKKFLETIVVFFSSPTLEDKPIEKSAKGGTDSLGLSGTSKQLHAYKLLRENLSARPCGKPSCRDKFCKVDLNGNHGLSLNEFQAWGDALAAGIEGATVDTPPHNERFKRFHRDLFEMAGQGGGSGIPSRDRKHKDKEASLGLPPAVSQFFERFDRVLGTAPTAAPSQSVPARIVSKLRGPKISDFLAELQENEGNLRNYVKYADEFAAHELCFIGELVGWTCNDFQTRIKMQIGSAQMVQQAVADKMAELESAVHVQE